MHRRAHHQTSVPDLTKGLMAESSQPPNGKRSKSGIGCSTSTCKVVCDALETGMNSNIAIVNIRDYSIDKQPK